MQSQANNPASSTPTLPKGLKAETVRPLLKANDPETAALAGYVLVLRDDAAGLAPLLAASRRRGPQGRLMAEAGLPGDRPVRR